MHSLDLKDLDYEKMLDALEEAAWPNWKDYQDFTEWCNKAGLDPSNQEEYEAWLIELEYIRNPWRYNDVKRSDL